MRRVMGVVVLAVVMLTGCAGLQTQERGASVFKMMEDIQEQITWQVWNANGWAGSPIVVEAVLAQNAKGPIPDMDNAKWKKVPEADAIVQGFINNEAAKFLKAEMAKTDGICTGAFLNAANGEKVAFTDKTGSYIHKGSAKFDVPFTTGKPWQGKPELDDSALVVEIDGSKLEALAKK
jgi:hypothetical protein